MEALREIRGVGAGLGIAQAAIAEVEGKISVEGQYWWGDGNNHFRSGRRSGQSRVFLLSYKHRVSIPMVCPV